MAASPSHCLGNDAGQELLSATSTQTPPESSARSASSSTVAQPAPDLAGSPYQFADTTFSESGNVFFSVSHSPESWEIPVSSPLDSGSNNVANSFEPFEYQDSLLPYTGFDHDEFLNMLQPFANFDGLTDSLSAYDNIFQDSMDSDMFHTPQDQGPYQSFDGPAWINGSYEHAFSSNPFLDTEEPAIPSNAQNVSTSVLPASTTSPAPAARTNVLNDSANYGSYPPLGQSPRAVALTRHEAWTMLQWSLQDPGSVCQLNTVFFIISGDPADRGPHCLTYHDQLGRRMTEAGVQQYFALRTGHTFPLGSHLFLANACAGCEAHEIECDGDFPCKPCQDRGILCLPIPLTAQSAASNEGLPRLGRKRKAASADEAQRRRDAEDTADESDGFANDRVRRRRAKRVCGTDEPDGETLYRDRIPGAPPLLTQLPDTQCTDEELLAYHPNHVKWPLLAARLIRNGWTPPAVAKYVNASHGLYGTADEMKSNTYTKMISNSGLVVYEKGNGKRGGARWIARTDKPTPDLTITPSKYEPRHARDRNKVKDYRLADVIKGVVAYPTGDKAGTYTQCIRYAVDHPEERLMISDVPRIIQKLQVAESKDNGRETPTTFGEEDQDVLEAADILLTILSE